MSSPVAPTHPDYSLDDDSDFSEPEGEPYAPRKPSTRTIRRRFRHVKNEGPSITLTTPASHGNPAITEHEKTLSQKIAEPGKLNPGTWRQAMSQHRRECRARDKEEGRGKYAPPSPGDPDDWTEKKSKHGMVYYINLSAGTSTWERPEGYLNPNERFKMGMGIDDVRAELRRKRLAFEATLTSPEDELRRMFQTMSIQDNEPRDQAKVQRAEVPQSASANERPRSRSGIPKPRYYAKLQAQEVHTRENVEDTQTMAAAPHQKETPAESVPNKAPEERSFDLAYRPKACKAQKADHGDKSGAGDAKLQDMVEASLSAASDAVDARARVEDLSRKTLDGIEAAGRQVSKPRGLNAKARTWANVAGGRQ